MELTLHSVVGPSGRNAPDDVKLIRALLNVYRRKVRDRPLPLLPATDPELFTAIARFQVGQGASVASSSVTPQSSSWRALLGCLAASRTVQPVIPPAKGRLTWEAEGQEGGRFSSRVLHVPTASSGLTLGRGYDFGGRSRVEVQQCLSQAGLNATDAGVLSGGVRLWGRAAGQFIIDTDLLDFEISPGCQLRLFEAAYAETKADVQKICARRDVIEAHGTVDWLHLDFRIREVLVDLHYRGDYTELTRRALQDAIVRNDFSGFARVLSDSVHWADVPADRFQRRQRFLA